MKNRAYTVFGLHDLRDKKNRDFFRRTVKPILDQTEKSGRKLIIIEEIGLNPSFFAGRIAAKSKEAMAASLLELQEEFYDFVKLRELFRNRLAVFCDIGMLGMKDLHQLADSLFADLAGANQICRSLVPRTFPLAQREDLSEHWGYETEVEKLNYRRPGAVSVILEPQTAYGIWTQLVNEVLGELAWRKWCIAKQRSPSKGMDEIVSEYAKAMRFGLASMSFRDYSLARVAINLAYQFPELDFVFPRGRGHEKTLARALGGSDRLIVDTVVDGSSRFFFEDACADFMEKGFLTESEWHRYAALELAMLYIANDMAGGRFDLKLANSDGDSIISAAKEAARKEVGSP